MLQIALAIALPTKSLNNRRAEAVVSSTTAIDAEDDDDDLNGDEKTLQVDVVDY